LFRFIEAGEKVGVHFLLFDSPFYPISGLAETDRISNGEFGIAAVAQLVERVLGKDEVMGPSPISS
jgi:hypothetical protein